MPIRRTIPSTSLSLLLLITGACNSKEPLPDSTSAAPPQLLAPTSLSDLPSTPPDARVAYGPDSSEYGDLRIPGGGGPHPVAILIHGGCFKAAYATTRDLAAMADALKAQGIATWSIEYRRLGQPGGGWPGTYLDIAQAVDFLATLARPHHLDLSRVVLVGHSAGGHLAMWAAGRRRVPDSSPIGSSPRISVRGVVDLAGPLDLTAHRVEYEHLCHDAVITTLMGGTPHTVPDHYAHASPIRLVPLGVPQVLIIGEHEDFVPYPFIAAYAQAARHAGDSVRVIVIPRVGHFEIANPLAAPWPTIQDAIVGLLDGRLPPPSPTPPT